jgi:hypothetical protein
VLKSSAVTAHDKASVIVLNDAFAMGPPWQLLRTEVADWSVTRTVKHVSEIQNRRRRSVVKEKREVGWELSLNWHRTTFKNLRSIKFTI